MVWPPTRSSADLLANLHVHLEHEVDLDRVVEIRRTSAAAVTSLADEIEHALPAPDRTIVLVRRWAYL